MTSTGNPRAAGNPPSREDAPQESVGAIASDSLAAESLQDGGDFSRGQATSSSVSGSNSTFNTTDTSGATALHPAASGAERERQDARGQGSDEKGTTGLKYPEAAGQPEFSGSHNLDGYTGGPAADRQTSGFTGSTGQATGASDFGATTTTSGTEQSEADNEIKSSGNTDAVPGSINPSSGSGNTQTSSSGTTGSSGPTSSSGPSTGSGPSASTSDDTSKFGDTAPTYASTVSGSLRTESEMKPKGTNLNEGDIPETKTFTGDVGGQHDPGRLAEQDFQKITANAPGGDRDESGAGENPYDALRSSERA